jgi:hypothetical protein
LVTGGFVLTMEVQVLKARFRVSIHIGYDPESGGWYLKPLMPRWLSNLGKHMFSVFNPRSWKNFGRHYR